jgi:hypothetical protein
MRFVQIFLFVIPTAYSWGKDGHKIIVSWAKDLLSDKGKKFLATHVTDDLSSAATWADTLRALSKYPQSESHHFSHTPYRDCQEFRMERDCGLPGSEGECIVTGLADAIELALDTTASSEQRGDAIKFSLHFMGDIHQPLHVGFRKDFGGTAIKLNGGKSLHEFWDNELIDKHIKSFGPSSTWLTVADEYRNSFKEEQITRTRGTHDMKTVLSSSSKMIEYAAWLASDTAITTTCKHAYTIQADQWIVDGQKLTEKYIKERTPVMIMALNKAAIRLAHLVDGMALALEDQKPPETPVRIRKEAKLFETKISADPSFNRFEILRIDSKDIEQPMGESEKVTVELKGSKKKTEKKKESASGKKKKKQTTKKDQEDDDEYFNEVLAQYSADNRRKFEGIDLSSIQSMDFNGVDLITSIENAKVSGYQPSDVTSFRVAFDRNGSKEPKMYFFDCSVFGCNISIELGVRCILKVSGVPVDGLSNIDKYWTRSNTGRDMVERDPWVIADMDRVPIDETSLVGKLYARVKQARNDKQTA